MKNTEPLDTATLIRRLREAGKSYAEISRETGLSIHAIRRILDPDYQKGHGFSGRKSGNQTVVPFKLEDPAPAVRHDWSGWVRHLRESQAFRGAKPQTEQSALSLTFEDDGLPIGISIFSDLHCGDSGVTYDLLDRHVQLVRDTPGMYCVLNGDELNNFLGALSWAGRGDLVQNEQQWQMVEALLEELRAKILTVTRGNHNLWNNRHGGADMQGRILSRFGLLDIGEGAKLYLSVGEQLYTLMLRHRFRRESANNPGNAIIAMHDEFGPFDIGVIGHVHVAAVGWQFKQDHMIGWIRPGSYKVVDDYAESLGFPHAVPLSPAVILFPDRKKFRIYADIGDACEDLAVYRQRYAANR